MSSTSSSSAYTLQLPYLGTIPLGKSPPNLASFQKPLRELYIPYYRQRRERHPDERRIIISDRDILIFEPDAASKGKRALIYSTLEAIVDVQALEFYLMFNASEHHHHKRIRAAFLPIGCEHQERFRSLYSTIDKSQYNLLSIPSSTSVYHPPLVLFVIRKTGAGGTCSLLDCHVFAVRRESIAFELCDMIRKLIIKRTMSPILPKSHGSGTTLLRVKDHDQKHTTMEKRPKYFDRDRPISAMEHRQGDIPIPIERKNTTRSGSITTINENPPVVSNGLSNPLLSSSSSFFMNHIPHSQSYHDTSKVLAMENDPTHPRMSSPSNTSIRTLSTKNHHRHFIKASTSSQSLVIDESDEVVNDLMNIVVTEKLKTSDMSLSQAAVKRHASFDQNSSLNGSQDFSFTKKRYQFNAHHQKKRSYLINPNPLPTILSANNTPVISRTTTTIEQTVHPPAPSSSSTSSLLEQHQPQPLAPIDNQPMRPQFILHRYGDIGNYVPKLLRDNVSNTPTPIRSSDSNENIFFRATNGHIINGFLNLDFAPNAHPTAAHENVNHNNHNHNNNNNNHPHYRSSPCLNEDVTDRKIFSLVRQLRKNQTKHFGTDRDSLNSNDSQMNSHLDPSYRIPRASVPPPMPQMTKPTIAAMGGIKVLPESPPNNTQNFSRPLRTTSTSSNKPRRVSSFTIADTELPVDYRQYLRHTDQGDFLYGEEQQRRQKQQIQQEQSTFEHTLGYFP